MTVNQLLPYWPVFVGVITFVGGYVTLRSQSNNQERRLSRLEGQVEAMSPIFLQIQKDLIAIQTTLKFVEQKIDKL